MKKLLLVFGTRPEAIKMAPLVLEFKKIAGFETLVCVTGQHREMLDQVLQLFEIKPDFDLDIMRANQDLYDITSRILLGLREVLTEISPDFVFVHGDTATSTATALAAFYKQIPVVHIEAGLRTYNIYSPYPEEMNRQITGRIASCHIAPTKLSKENLLKENIADDKIFITGNTVIDALQWVIGKIEKDKAAEKLVIQTIKDFGYDLGRMGRNRKLVLITGHRRENFGSGFINICEAIKELAEKYPQVDFVYPMHLNPNVRKPINEIFSLDKNNSSNQNVFFIEPLDYLPFVYLMNKSYLVLTDSGGIQEEAPGLGKPVVVMRDTTERPEAVDAGTVVLVGTDKQKIINTVSNLIDCNSLYEKMAQAQNPYGDGKACKRIVEIFKNN
ncbi:MAG: UDP-N-acetylglucosamine 2-epimerase [Bacteroidetes bacterium ADurb.Bin174]|mgnify:CR=1 FL=1|nr:MAG: UDP-N-acetylglucosamine 2-epimerase [Bacteroidetes bacterium ADurb.Bin174]